MTGGRWMAGALIGAMILFLWSGMAGAAAAQNGDMLVLNNDTIEVMFLTFAPGEVSAQHANPQAELGIILEGELTLITPAGQEILKPGMVRWLAPLTPHEARNDGTAPVKMWALTLKKCL